DWAACAIIGTLREPYVERPVHARIVAPYTATTTPVPPISPSSSLADAESGVLQRPARIADARQAAPSVKLMDGHHHACARHCGDISLSLIQEEGVAEGSGCFRNAAVGPQHLRQSELHVATQVEP